MAFRFFRRIKIAPGLRLNLSKSGPSLSLGRRGARYTIGSRGRRTTFGIPGTGLFYTTTSGRRKRKAGRAGGSNRSTDPGSSHAMPSPTAPLTLSFLQRLVTPKREEAFVDGCRELVKGNETAAVRTLSKSDHADALFLAGVLALKQDRCAEADRWLSKARANPRQLGRLFRKYGVTPRASLAVTDEVVATIEPTTRGLLLGLVEAYQRLGRVHDAADCLNRLRRLEPDDPVVTLSVVELLMDSDAGNRHVLQRIVKLTEGVSNDSSIHAALLLYKAKALHGLGLLAPARHVLSTALRKKKGRSGELLHALRYERAAVYEALGQAKRARSDLEQIYAEAPDYEDVSKRLGLSAS